MDRSDFRHYFNSAHKSQTGKWAINRFVLPRWYTDIAAPQLEQKNYGKIEIYLSIFSRPFTSLESAVIPAKHRVDKGKGKFVRPAST